MVADWKCEKGGKEKKMTRVKNSVLKGRLNSYTHTQTHSYVWHTNMLSYMNTFKNMRALYKYIYMCVCVCVCITYKKGVCIIKIYTHVYYTYKYIYMYVCMYGWMYSCMYNICKNVSAYFRYLYMCLGIIHSHIYVWECIIYYT